MIKLITTIHKNPVGRTFLGLIFALIFGTSALLLSIFLSDQLGNVEAPYQVKETYKFDHWVLNFDYMTLEFPEGGYVIPGYQNDRIASMLIVARGNIYLEASDTFKNTSNLRFPISDEVSEVVIPVFHEDFDRLKKDTIFIEEQISYPTEYLQERLESAKVLLFQGNIMGMEKIIPPTSRSVMLKISSTQNGEMVYREDSRVNIESEGVNFEFNHPIGLKKYPIPYVNTTMFFYNLLLLLAFLGLIAFLTTDFMHDDTSMPSYLDKLPAVFHILGFSLYSYLIKWLSITYYIESVIQLILYLIPVLYLIYCLVMAKVPIKYIGITYNKLVKGIIVSLVIFYLWFLAATFQIVPTSIYDTTSLIIVFLLIFISQILLRGFVQSTLELLLGKWIGLVLSALIIMVIPLLDFLPNFQNTNWLLTISGYFAISLITSYSYQRTRNILAPTLLTLLFSFVIPNLF